MTTSGSRSPAGHRHRWGMRHARIRTKLFIVTGTSLLSLAVVGTAGIAGMAAVNARAQQLDQHAAVPLSDLAAVRDGVGDNRVDALAVLRATTPAALRAAVANIADADSAVDGAVAAYLAAHRTDLGAQRAAVVAEFRQRYTAWRAVRSQMVALVAAGDLTKANQVYDTTLTAANSAYEEETDKLSELEAANVPATARVAAKTYRTLRLVMIVTLGVGALLSLGLGLLVSGMIVRPIRRVLGVLNGLAKGDLTQEVGVTSGDELGLMSEALDSATASLRTLVATIAGNAEGLAGAAEQLAVSNREITASAELTSRQAVVVSSSADAINTSVSSVAGGAEEIGRSIREISGSASEAATVATSAVGSASAASESMRKLAGSSAEINTFVAVIGSIAEQTHTLALNATIEAARAGGAGRGFGVVAAEVRELANAATRASADIANRITTIQTDTQTALSAIGETGAVVGLISDYATTIAAAVEEQTATTHEMTRSLADAAQVSGQIAGNIATVATASNDTTGKMAAGKHTVDELTRMAGDLEAVVRGFRY